MTAGAGSFPQAVRRAVAIPALCAGVLAIGAGCGGDGGFSDGEIEKAAKIEGNAVGGDPFCKVDEVLNDADEIATAGERKGAAIITSREGNVGVSVVPPFPDDCALTVRKGLDKLDPREKSQ
jgi:hypothetical protein